MWRFSGSFTKNIYLVLARLPLTPPPPPPAAISFSQSTPVWRLDSCVRLVGWRYLNVYRADSEKNLHIVNCLNLPWLVEKCISAFCCSVSCSASFSAGRKFSPVHNDQVNTNWWGQAGRNQTAGGGGVCLSPHWWKLEQWNDLLAQDTLGASQQSWT